MLSINKRINNCIHNVRVLSEALNNELNEANSILTELLEMSKGINESNGTEVKSTIKEYGGLINRLVGDSSIFTEYLSPSIIYNGKGFITVTDDFKQYVNDIDEINAADLVNWPSGFYRNSNTMERQLLLVTKSFIVLLDGLPVNTRMPFVYKLPYKAHSGILSVDDLSSKDLDLLINETTSLLIAISIMYGTSQ
jgi:hypothetical protein